MNLEKKFRKLQKKMSQGRYRKAVRGVSLGAAVICAAALGIYFYQGREAEQEIDSLREIKEEAKWDGPGGADASGQEPENTGAILPQYQELYSMNQDFIGWLTVDGTAIDYPVMWTPQDTEYYSHRGFDGADSANGLLFMDGACNTDTAGGNVIIYGHNMKNGSMFADLLEYGKQSYWEEHPTIQFDTLYETRVYEIAAVAKTGNIDLLPFGFVDASEEEFEKAAAAMKENALYDTGVEMSYGEDFLTLATCDYSVDNGRMVVMARRIE